MATRQVLAELTQAFAQQSGIPVDIESVGGVDAAKRVQAGEAFDVVILGSDAIDKLIAAGIHRNCTTNCFEHFTGVKLLEYKAITRSRCR